MLKASHNDETDRTLGADDNKEALEAKDLANDEFFYKNLAREIPSSVGEPAGDDVELIEPASTAKDGRKSTNTDKDVELVQGRNRTDPSHKRYVEEEQNQEGEEEDDDEVEEGDSKDVEPKLRTLQYTKEFDTKADLLKEVQQIVKQNEKLTKEADGDVYWEIEYEHPKY